MSPQENEPVVWSGSAEEKAGEKAGKPLEQINGAVRQTPTQPGLATMPRRARLLPNLVLAGVLGSILLLLALWLGGLRASPFSPANSPTLSLSSAGPYYIGSTVKLEGRGFSSYAIVALIRDGQPATDSDGQRLALNTDQRGNFTATLIVTPNWGPGDHVLGAQDTTSQQSATLIIHIESGQKSP